MIYSLSFAREQQVEKRKFLVAGTHTSELLEFFQSQSALSIRNYLTKNPLTLSAANPPRRAGLRHRDQRHELRGGVHGYIQRLQSSRRAVRSCFHARRAELFRQHELKPYYGKTDGDTVRNVYRAVGIYRSQRV